MKRDYAYIVLFLCFYTLKMDYAFSQNNFIFNPSFEGAWVDLNGISLPDGWTSCQNWSDPDYDGSGRVLDAVDGNVIALMRTRAYDYDDGGGHDPNTTEYMVNKLKYPLEPGSCFRFSVYLAYTPSVMSNTMLEDRTSHPVKFEIRGTNRECPESMDEILTYELLYETEDVITNTSFWRYEMDLVIKDSTYTNLLFRAVWDEDYLPYNYNGILAVDNMSMDYLKESGSFFEETLYFTKNPPMQLKAPNGTYWEWSPKANLSDPNKQTTFVNTYDSIFTVYFHDDFNCPAEKKFNLLYNCDTIYGNDIYKTKTVYYKPNVLLQLIADDGISYQWNSEVSGLSDYAIQDPVVLDYLDSISVWVVDDSDLRCPFTEKFFVVADCDSIEKGMEKIYFDTVEYGESIILDPGEGSLFEEWQPILFLDAPDVLTPLASPENSITYTAILSKSYGNVECLHKKVFHIILPLKIPNVITPNNDGFNDLFVIPGLLDNSGIAIYNKHGSLVYQNNNYGKDNWWDGTIINGNDKAETGNYWYVLEEPGKKAIMGFVLVKAQ